MYSTHGQYQAVPTDPECPQNHELRGYGTPGCLKKRALALERTLLLRIGALFLIILIIVTTIICRLVLGPAIMFDPAAKPVYLNIPVDKPLVIRLAIISRVDAFQRRQALREAVLDGIPGTDVQLEYKFFVGQAALKKGGKGSFEAQRTMLRLAHENEVHDDIMILHDLEDVPERISEKRFRALKWTNSVPHDEYDYSMTMDSDTFCRFRTLARRIQHMYPSLKPRDEPILIGRMSKHAVYWENTIPDGNAIAQEEDSWVGGPVYPYPIGIAYMLSSNLTATILSADPAVPHHINYPFDDVMIGSWVAGLKELHNPSAMFQLAKDAPQPSQHCEVRLAPYLPHPVNTTIVDDKIGWHDYRRRGSVATAHAIGWDTACVHRMLPLEMIAFRAMDEIKMEWDY